MSTQTEDYARARSRSWVVPGPGPSALPGTVIRARSCSSRLLLATHHSSIEPGLLLLQRRQPPPRLRDLGLQLRLGPVPQLHEPRQRRRRLRLLPHRLVSVRRAERRGREVDDLLPAVERGQAAQAEGLVAA